MVNYIYILDVKNIDYNNYYKYLTDIEKERINHKNNEEDKLLSLCCYLLINLFTANEELKFSSNGRPFKNKKPYFSISHSYPYSILSLSDDLIGVDIENINRLNNNFKNKLFSLNEKKYINKDEDYIKLWTIKEAAYKMIQKDKLFSFKDELILNKNKCFYLNNELFYKTIKYKNFMISLTSKKHFEVKANQILLNENKYNLIQI